MWIKCKTHSISFFLKTGTLIESNFHMFVDILKLNFPSITYMYISQQILKDCLLKYRKSKPTGIYTLCLMENITRHEGKITRIYCRRLSTHIAQRNNILWKLGKALVFFFFIFPQISIFWFIAALKYVQWITSRILKFLLKVKVDLLFMKSWG